MSVAAGVAPGGAQSSRCPRRSRNHPFRVGARGWGGREGRLPGSILAAAAAGRLASREVSLGAGAREANSLLSCAREKFPGRGESGGLPSTGTPLALFGAGFLPRSSANPGKWQTLPRKLPGVVWR